MIVIGLTGSIAMGKTAAAKYFADAGAPVFSADDAVHQIYDEPETVSAVAKMFPAAIANGTLDRQLLGSIVLGSSEQLKDLESFIHPLVRLKRTEFTEKWKQKKCPFVVLDIPLLFETGEDKNVDYKVVVSASEDIQRQRALARPGMTEEKLAGILARQMPDHEKRKRADYILETSGNLAELKNQVENLVTIFQASSRNQQP